MSSQNFSFFRNVIACGLPNFYLIPKYVFCDVNEKYTELLTQLLGKSLSLDIVVHDGKPVLLAWVLTKEREGVEL